MFGFLSALLVLALFSFGGVQPQSYLFLAILWLCGAMGLIAIQVLKSRRFAWHSIAFIGFALGVQWLDPKLAVGLLAAGWSWCAARQPLPVTLRFLRFLMLIGVFEVGSPGTELEFAL